MKSFTVLGVVLTLFVGLSIRSAHAVIPPPTLDREYRFGDYVDEAGVAGQIVGSTDGFSSFVTWDGEGSLGVNELIDMTVRSKSAFPFPKYVAITDRPDGVSGLGISLNPVSFDQHYLSTGQDEALNFPELSPSSTESLSEIGGGGTIDYSFITDRGFQLWVKPGFRDNTFTYFGLDQHIVMDSNNHGVLINANGKFAMRYRREEFVNDPANWDFEGLTSAEVGTWYHLMVARPFGPGRTGSVLYVNGVAETAVNGKYFAEDVPNDEVDEMSGNVHDALVVGANTSPEQGTNGQSNFFTGVVDDLDMFLMGLNNTGDYGEFEFERENGYAAFFKPTTDGDLDDDDDIDMVDVSTFASNWLFENVVGGLLVGDLSSRAVGDFNYDGRVDLGDWNILNDASPAMAAAAMSLIQSVPEPTTLALMALALLGAVSPRIRRNR